MSIRPCCYMTYQEICLFKLQIILYLSNDELCWIAFRCAWSLWSVEYNKLFIIMMWSPCKCLALHVNCNAYPMRYFWPAAVWTQLTFPYHKWWRTTPTNINIIHKMPFGLNLASLLPSNITLSLFNDLPLPLVFVKLFGKWTNCQFNEDNDTIVLETGCQFSKQTKH